MLAVIAGATGLTGSKLLRLLIEDSSFSRVMVLTRRPLGFDHPKVEVRVVPDFLSLSSTLLIPTGATFFAHSEPPSKRLALERPFDRWILMQSCSSDSLPKRAKQEPSS